MLAFSRFCMNCVDCILVGKMEKNNLLVGFFLIRPWWYFRCQDGLRLLDFVRVKEEKERVEATRPAYPARSHRSSFHPEDAFLDEIAPRLREIAGINAGLGFGVHGLRGREQDEVDAENRDRIAAVAEEYVDDPTPVLLHGGVFMAVGLALAVFNQIIFIHTVKGADHADAMLSNLLSMYLATADGSTLSLKYFFAS